MNEIWRLMGTVIGPLLKYILPIAIPLALYGIISKVKNTKIKLP